MSNTIDQRVVEMRFDNRQFEANVATSMSTLEKLKRSLKLDNATKSLEGLDAASKKVNFNVLSEGVETVKAKFSALQVIGVTALTNITNSAVNAGKQLVKSLTIDQVTAGWSKYEQKTASVQTIMNSTGKTIDEVNGYLDKLMWYSDETSYGFSDMTQSLAQLTSAGGDIDKLIPMIEGIANATAFAGKGAAEFSRAIYNLNQSYSAGYLQYMDWRSLELAGVASKQLKQVFIDTAVAMGKVAEGEITIANFSETLKDKWADTSVMEAAFSKFAEVTEAAYAMVENSENRVDTATQAYKILSGELTEAELATFKLSDAEKELIGSFDKSVVAAAKAAQQAKTFTEAIEATKDAVSSSFMRMFETVFGNFDQQIKLWSELTEGLYTFFAEPLVNFEDILGGAFNSKWEGFIELINEAGIATEDFQSSLSETLKEHNKSLDDLISEYGSLEEAVASGEISTSMIVDTFKKLAGSTDTVSQSTEDLNGKLEKFQSIVDQVWNGDFGNGADRMKAMADAGYDYAEVQELVNKTVDGHRLTLDDLSDAQLESIGYTQDEIDVLHKLAEQAEKTGTPINKLIESLQKPSGRSLLIDSFRNILTSIASFINSIRDAWSETFVVTSSSIYNAIKKFNDLTKKLKITEDTADKLKRTFKGLFAIIDIVRQIIGGAFNAALKVTSELFGGLGGKVLDTTASIGDMLSKFNEWLKKNKAITKTFDAMSYILVSIIDLFKSWIKSVGEIKFVKTSLEKVRDVLASIFDGRFIATISGWVNGIGEWLQKIREMPIVAEILTTIKEVAIGTFDDLKEYLGEGMEKVSEFIEHVKELDGLTLDNVREAFRYFKEDVIGYFLDMEGRFDDISKLFDNFGKGWFKKLLTGGAVKSLEGTSGAWGSLTEAMGTFFKEVGVKLNDNVGMGEILTMLLGGSLVYGMSKFGKVLDKIKTPLESFIGVADSAAGVLKSTSGAIKTFATSIKVKSVLTIAGALAILAGSIWLLAQIDDPGKLWNAVGAIAALAVVLGLLAFALGKMKSIGGVEISKKGVSSTFVSILGIAAAIGILVLALKGLDKINPDNVWENLGIMALMLVALTGVACLIGNFSKLNADIAKGSLALIVISWAIRSMVKSFAAIDAINSDHILSDLGVLGGIVTAVAIIGVTCGKVIGMGAAASILALVIAIKVIVGILQTLADPNAIDVQAIYDNMDNIKTILIGLIALMAITKIGGRNGASGGIGVLAMTAAIYVLIGAIKVLGNVPDDQLKKGAVTVGALMVVFGAVAALSHFAGKYAIKAGAMLILMSGAMIIIAGIIVVLANVAKDNPDGLTKATHVVGAVLFIFGLVVAASGFAAKVKTGPLVAIAVSLGILLVALGALSMIPEDNLIKAETAIIIALGMFAALVAATDNMTSSIGSLIVLTVAIGMIGAVLYALGTLETDNALNAAIGLGAVLLAMAASMCILGKADFIINSIAPLIVMTVAIGIIGAVLYALGTLDTDNALKSALGLSAVLLALAGAMCILGASQGVTLSGAGALLIVSVGLIAIAAACKIMEEVSWESIGKGLVALAGALLIFLGASAIAGIPLVAAGIGVLVIGIVGLGVAALVAAAAVVVFGAGLTLVGKALPLLATGIDQIGLAIQSFVTNIASTSSQLGDFGNVMSTIGSSVCEALLKVALGMAAVGAAGLIMGPGLITAGAGLVVVSLGITTLAASIVLLSAAIASGVDMIIGTFIRLEQEAKDAGANTVLGFIGGILNGLGGIVEACSSFVNTVKTTICNLLGIESPSRVAMEWGKFTGEGYSIGLDESKSGAENTATGFVGAIKSIFSDSGLPETTKTEGTNAGENFNMGLDDSLDLDSIMSDLGASGIDTESLKSIMNSEGTESGTSFNTGLGDSLDVQSIMSELNNGGVDLSQFQSILNAEGTEAGTGFTTNLTDSVDLSSFQSSMFTGGSDAGRSFSDGVITGIDVGGINEVLNRIVSAVNDKKSQFTSGGTNITSGLASGITTGSSIVVSAMNNVLTHTMSTVTTRISLFRSAGTQLIRMLASGIQNGRSSVSSAMGTVLSGALSSVSSYSSRFSSAGSSVVEGFCRGISNNTFRAEAAASAMAQAALDAAKDVLKVNSPSKKFIKLGSSVCEGFRNGIRDNSYMGTDAVETLGEDILSTFRGVLGIHSPAREGIKDGLMYVWGIVTGIFKKKSMATDSVEDLGEDIIEKAKETLDLDKIANIGEDVTETLADSLDMENIGDNMMTDLASGINNNTSAEDAAEAKAKAISDKFKGALDTAKLNMTTEDLEYELWENNNPNATDAQKAEAQRIFSLKKRESQLERVALAQAEYNETLDAFGASSDNAREAYNKYLQEQIDLSKLDSEIASLNSLQGSSRLEAFEKYNELINQGLALIEDKVLEDGTVIKSNFEFSKEEIMAWASEESGYITKTLEDELNSSVSGELSPCMKDWGVDAAKALGGGIKETTPVVVTTTANMVNEALEVFDARESEWKEKGKNSGKGYAEGIEETIPVAVSAAAKMAAGATTTVTETLAIHSPSRVFKEIGSYIPAGLALGIQSMGGVVKDSATTMAQNAINSAKNTISTIGNVINHGSDIKPTIRPVVDMSNINTEKLRLTSNLSVSLTKPIDSLSSIIASAQDEINASNREVVSAIRGLREDLNNFYSDDGSEVALYVDSKKLASSIAKPMNRQLNILSKRGAY